MSRSSSGSNGEDYNNNIRSILNRVDSVGSDDNGENHRYFSGNNNFENPQSVLKSRLSKI